jgi:hypothetical protein
VVEPNVQPHVEPPPDHHLGGHRAVVGEAVVALLVPTELGPAAVEPFIRFAEFVHGDDPATDPADGPTIRPSTNLSS